MVKNKEQKKNPTKKQKTRFRSVPENPVSPVGGVLGQKSLGLCGEVMEKVAGLATNVYKAESEEMLMVQIV